jgi:hypothetical protein
MSHPARGPIGTMGIDGKAIAACRRRPSVRWTMVSSEAAK